MKTKPRLKMVIPKVYGEFNLPNPFWEYPELGPPRLADTPLKSIYCIHVELVHEENSAAARATKALIVQATRDKAVAHAVCVAAAHVIAKIAIEDPYFRPDRFKTRVDEWVYHRVWSLAQEIYEANAAYQIPEQAAMCSPQKTARGMGIRGEDWSSGRIFPRVASANGSAQ